MTTLLVLRERIKKLYARYGGIVMRVFKFLLAFAAFFAGGNHGEDEAHRYNHQSTCQLDDSGIGASLFTV